ncbi:unnamed protein product [Mytilus edulis]|uniref:Uncharacterized protein n=1 Tax=Mytilus edulis TaxID=6550 RepID=A0A8S3T1G0_MYTED|nr:unnamed protein product [Mytilus edulis]
MGSVYVDEIEKKILQTKEHIFISSYMLKYEKLCCDYWRNKCAEFERAQIQVFEKETEALHMKDPKVFSKSMEKDCQKTMEEIRKFRTYVNNINILIKVFGKTEDVNTLLVNEEIAKTVLSKVDLLKDEVQKLLSGMLLEAVINSKESAEVGFNVTIPTITEGTCQINSDDKHDKAEKADHPAIHDCKTRTDFDEGTSQINSDDEHDQAEKADHPSAIHDCKTRTEFDVIKENDVAVSFNRDIEIIDINTEQVKNTIVTRGVTSGISYQNKLMYVVIGHRTIDVMKITGEIFRSIHCPFQSLHIGLSTDTDSLFLTDPFNSTVYCCDLYGSVRWKFSNVKMPMPTGVTTDDNGNVYIVCNKSNNVVVVSPDGKTS